MVSDLPRNVSSRWRASKVSFCAVAVSCVLIPRKLPAFWGGRESLCVHGELALGQGGDFALHEVLPERFVDDRRLLEDGAVACVAQ